MTEPSSHAVNAPEPRKKRKYTRRKRQLSPRVVPFEKKDEFAGMTSQKCCDACREGHCTITGYGTCCHPYKAGLTAKLMSDPVAFARWQRAKKMLEHQTIDLRST